MVFLSSLFLPLFYWTKRKACTSIRNIRKGFVRAFIYFWRKNFKWILKKWFMYMCMWVQMPKEARVRGFRPPPPELKLQALLGGHVDAGTYVLLASKPSPQFQRRGFNVHKISMVTVLVRVSLLWIGTVSTASGKHATGLAYRCRGFVYYCHGGRQGSVQPGMVLGKKSCEFYVWIFRHQEERDAGPALSIWKLRSHFQWHTSSNESTPTAHFPTVPLPMSPFGPFSFRPQQ